MRRPLPGQVEARLRTERAVTDEEIMIPDVGTRAGIPTTFAGTRFRSRLEAKWAALFDSIELRWVYEPLDLGGQYDGYCPDFLLLPDTCSAGPVLVECRPVIWTHARANHGEWPDDAPEGVEILARARAAGWRGPFALLGATLGPVVCGLSSLGVCYAPDSDRPEPLCLASADPSTPGAPGSFILEHAGGWGSWQSERAPRPGGRFDWVRTLHRHSGNVVQWQAR